MVSYFAKKKKEQAMIADKSSFRKDKQKHRKAMKSTAEKVSRFSFLTPALVLVPATDGKNELQSQDFKDLKRDSRELVIAAAHIEDAKTGRGSCGKAVYYFKPRHAQIAFKIITNQWFQYLIYAAVLVHSALAFIEPPSEQPRSNYGYSAVAVTFVCLLIYLADIILNMVFLSWKIFWTLDEYKWNRREFILLCGFTIDWILLIAQVISGNNDIIQPFRTLRLAMIMCKAKNVGHIYQVVQSITLKLSGIMLIVFVFIFLYSCIGVHLMMAPYEEILQANISAFRPIFDEGSDAILDQTNGSNSSIVFVNMRDPIITVNESNIYEGTFNHIGVAAYQLFILLTTENYPVFMFPALNVSHWYFTYFGTFLVFGVFFLTAILLAIIADYYWEHNKKHVKQERLKQRAELVKAWKILDPEGQERLPVDDPKLINLFRILKPKNTVEENYELIAQLDPDENGFVDWIQWVTQLISVLDLERTRRNNDIRSKYCYFSWYGIVSRFTKKITDWGLFEKLVLLLILIHSLLFTLMWKGMPLSAEVAIQGIRTAIVLCFFMEMILRFFSNGINSVLDMADLVLVVVAVASNLLWYTSLAPLIATSESIDVRLWRGFNVVIPSIAIFTRLFFNSSQSRRVMNVFLRLIPVMLDLIILFTIIMYFYGVIGMEAFHDFEITFDTPTADHFFYNCGLGFINFRCSMYIVFQLLTTSNWHDIMNTLIVSLDSYAPLIYFISCYIVINLVIMNLLVAIGIEAFNKFSQEQKAEMEEEGENAMTGDMANGSKQLKTNLCSLANAKKYLGKVAVWTRAAFSSTRESDNFGEEVVSGVFDGEGNNGRETISAPIQSRRSNSAWKSKNSSSAPVLVKEYVHVMNSQQKRHSISHIPTSSNINSATYTSRESISSALDCSYVTVELGAGAGGVQDVDDDSVFCSPYIPQSPKRSLIKQESMVSVATKLTRQEKLKKKLKEKQKEKIRSKGGSTQSVTKSQTPPPNIDDSDTVVNDVEPVTTKPEVAKWRPATRAIVFANHVSDIQYSYGDESVCSVADEAGDMQKAKKPLRRKISMNNGNGPRFRKAYNRGNWRSEVQNITIINKEEISQLRRQLNFKPALRTRRRSSLNSNLPGQSVTPYETSLSHDGTVQQDTVVSLGKVEEFLSRQHYDYDRRSSSNSADLQLDVSRLNRRHSSVCSESGSLSGGQLSLTSVDEDLGQSSTLDGTTVAKRFPLAPLISVEEVPEVEQLNTPIDEQMLRIPGGGSIGGTKSKRVGSRKKPERPKEMPEWVLKLTQQYNVSVHTEGTEETKEITQCDNIM